MGLDVVEVILELEDEFGIRISDAEAVRCNTVGDVYQLLLSKTGRDVPPAVCLSRVAFYRLRGPLQSVSGLDRGSIRPRARLADIFPREQRCASWQQLAAAVGVDVPALEKDGDFDESARLAAYAAFGSAVIGIYTVASAPLLGIAILALMPVCALVSAVYILRQNVAIADRLPLGVATVGDLAHAIKWQYYAETEQAERSAISVAGQATWSKLVGVLCEQLGVKPVEVTLDANLFHLAG